LEYASRGWAVFPVFPTQEHSALCSCPRGQKFAETDDPTDNCESPAKHPMTKNGLKDATTDTRTINGWWMRNPRANIGLPTGVTFDVLDVDCPDWEQGLEGLPGVYRTVFAKIMAGTIHAAETGKKGLHLLFEPTGIGNRAKFVGNCDWRGKGGYIVAPPSQHASGYNYRWLYDGDPPPLPKCPQFIIDALNAPKARTAAYDDLIPDVGGRSTQWAEKWSADGLVKRVLQAVEGERNDVVSWAGLKLWEDRNSGKVPNEQAFEHAYGEIYAAALSLGLSDHEVRLCLRRR
jgi:hypothetical protein